MVLRYAQEVTVVWPDGRKETYADVAVHDVTTERKDETVGSGTVRYLDVTLPHDKKIKETLT